LRSACKSVLTPSLGSASLRLEMLWVATIGMHFGCREMERKRSSPVGLSPPTVAKFWYSSQMKTVGRKCLCGSASHLWDTQHHGTLIVDLHHGAEGLGKRRVQSHGKVQTNDRARFDEFVE
jgi:hypothetical protein